MNIIIGANLTSYVCTKMQIILNKKVYNFS